jgi:hypothetical protein
MHHKKIGEMPRLRTKKPNSQIVAYVGSRGELLSKEEGLSGPFPWIKLNSVRIPPTALASPHYRTWMDRLRLKSPAGNAEKPISRAPVFPSPSIEEDSGKDFPRVLDRKKKKKKLLKG